MQSSNSGPVSIQECFSKPGHYKQCSNTKCVPISEQCPCEYGEFQCANGQCIPLKFVCNGRDDCLGGEDEQCSDRLSPDLESESGISISVVAAIVSVSVFVCLVAVILLWVYFLRRQRNNTSQESQSALNPLHAEKVSDEFESSKLETNKNYKTRHKDASDSNKYSTNIAFSDYSNSFRSSVMPSKQTHVAQDKTKIPVYKQSNEYCLDSDNNDITETATNAKSPDVLTNNKCPSCHSPGRNNEKEKILHPHKVPLDLKQGTREEAETKLGKYIYRPRTSGRKAPKVYHSYVPSHTEPSTPESMDFDKDNISFLFPHELLCASTPKQAVKQFELPEHPDIDFIDEPRTEMVPV